MGQGPAKVWVLPWHSLSHFGCLTRPVLVWRGCRFHPILLPVPYPGRLLTNPELCPKS